jgi:predicted transcriptional regulator
MRLHDVLAITESRPISADLDPDLEVHCGGAADLMSDVLRYNLSRALLVSGLANPQVVRTAEMAEVAAILLVRGKSAPPETQELADEVGIPILGTELNMFEACGRLYAAGLPACQRRNGHG